LVSKSASLITIAYSCMPHIPSASVLLNRLQAKARFRHLQVLVRLGELQSIRRTADALGLSQPAVTQCLADLERLVEIRLFDRHARGLRVTHAGREVLPLARRMLDALAEASEALTAVRQRASGVVRVAAITGAVGGLLVRALPAFAQAHPGITVHVHESAPEQWGLQLARGEVDLALVRQPAATPAGFEFRPLLHDRFVVVCRPGHRLAARRGLDWAALAEDTWLPQSVGSAARAALDQLMGDIGGQPRMVQVLTRASVLTVALVEALDVLALVPLSVVRPWVDKGELVLVDVQPAPPFPPLGIVLPTEAASQAALQFAGFIERSAAQQTDEAGPGDTVVPASRHRRPAG
jgi:DNA-binding transcriptional LysR family regulator